MWLKKDMPLITGLKQNLNLSFRYMNTEYLILAGR